MPEGPIHQKLVQALVTSIHERQGTEWYLFVDGEHTESHGIPPQLDSVRPDVYARERSTKHVIIGEAKTERDIENPHTHAQLAMYFRNLSEEASGEIIIAVPFIRAGLAHRVCRIIRGSVGCIHVPFQVCGWMFGRENKMVAWRG